LKSLFNPHSYFNAHAQNKNYSQLILEGQIRAKPQLTERN